jgi:tetratricopeptide (TPR) repeat protein
LVSLFYKALAWTGEQAFRFPPLSWVVCLVVSLALLFLAATSRIENLILLSAATVLITGVPLTRWMWLKRPSRRRPVVLARFGDEAGTHAEVMAAHLAQLRRRLSSNELLNGALEIRTLNASVNQDAARRILRHTSASAVIAGNALVVGESSRWEATLTVGWPETHSFVGPPGTGSIRHGFRAPKIHGIGGDFGLPVSTLTAEDFPAQHADGVEAALLMVASWGQFPSIQKQLLRRAERMASTLPLELRAALENAKAGIAAHESGEPASAARDLERIGESEVDHISLWNTAATFFLQAEIADPDFGTVDRLRVSLRGIDVAPTNSVANANVGIIRVGEKKYADARPYLERSVEFLEERQEKFAIYFYLTFCQEELGDIAAARRTLRELVNETARWWERRAAMSYLRSEAGAFRDRGAR